MLDATVPSIMNATQATALPPTFVKVHALLSSLLEDTPMDAPVMLHLRACVLQDSALLMSAPLLIAI